MLMRVNRGLGEFETGNEGCLPNMSDSECSKDREILRGDPHKLVEGCLVAGRAMNANAGLFDSYPIPHTILAFFLS
jgi:hypothetical protein